MMRHLTTWALSGLLGSILLVGNAEACHKKRCGGGCGGGGQVVCAQPVVSAAPVACAPRAKGCHHGNRCGGGGLCGHRGGGGHHQRPVACAGPVAYGSGS